MAPFAVQAIGEYDLGFNQPDSVTAGNFVFPSVVKVFYAGTLGETFSLFGEVSMENTGDAIDLGVPFRLEWNRRTAFNVAAGSIALDPTPNDRSLIPTLFNVSQLTSRNGWLLDGEQPGLEFWGAGNGPGGKGGWKYMTGVVNAQGGPVGRRQDVFARLTYKINGLGEIGGTQGQASTSSAFYEDNSLTLGGFVSTGRVGADLFADREDLTTWAGTLDGWYKRAILNAAVFNMKSQVNGLPDRNSLAWYAQGQYVVYPWLFGLARFEATHVDTNDGLDPQTTLIPALAAMARANIKVTLEYKRPMNDYSARKAAEEGMVAKLDFAL
jgi:hypothetical protein